MKIRLLIIFCLALAGCSKDPVQTTGTDNPGVAVDEVFTHEGVTVYRFQDAGHYVYFTKPVGPVEYSRTEYCGKGCSRQVRKQTLAVKPAHGDLKDAAK